MIKKVLPKTALISVSNKSGILTFARLLQKNGVKIFATGGTASALRGAGIKVSKVSSVSRFPEIFGGRVKTLSPYIFLVEFLDKEIRIKLKQKKTILLGLISLFAIYIHFPMLLKTPTRQWMKK